MLPVLFLDDYDLRVYRKLGPSCWSRLTSRRLKS